MANSKYEYVKSFETDDEIMYPNLIVVHLDGRKFKEFCEVHEYVKPNDIKGLELMNECAKIVLEVFRDIAFAYGFSDEYSFVFKKDTKFQRRRGSKLLSLIASFFTSTFVGKWKEFFPQKELQFPPSFRSRVICCASLEVLQSYLAWRQNKCHIGNLYDTCFWKLIEFDGMSEQKAQEFLKEKQKEEKNELLYQRNINYKHLPAIFRQGSCVFESKVEDIVKYNANGPVKRLRWKVITAHFQNIASRSFWNEHPRLVKDLGTFGEDANKVKPEFMKSFEFENKLLPYTWIVVRIDGCHFHRFSDVHNFEKPNDAQALNLMNSCAMAVVQEFSDIIFAYGVSDEYSFVLKKDSQFCRRRASEIVSVIVSFFSSMYVMKWKEFFPQKELKHSPYFDGRAVLYPSSQILQDYLAWRQVDCHINNQYNTCFWMLVNSDKQTHSEEQKKSKDNKKEAQNRLKGTLAEEKMELLRQNGIDYNRLPIMFRRGTSIFRRKEENGVVNNSGMKIVVDHCNIIEKSFWDEHPHILDEKKPRC